MAPNPPATPNLPATTTATNSYEVCKTLGVPHYLYTKPAPAISTPHSDWSDEDWDGERLRKREERKSKWRGKRQTRKR